VTSLQKQELLPATSKQVKKFIERLDSKAKQRIKEGIEKIPEGDIAPYRSAKGYFRLRIGDYRILFVWISDVQIAVDKIDYRGQVYK